MKNILVTGVAGFIGAAFVNYMVNKYPDYFFVGIDKITYCSSLKNISEIVGRKNFKFVKVDVADLSFIDFLMKEYHIDTVVHFAAYSHVDLSFGNSLLFTENNVLGTHNLLEASRINGITRFLNVSTDEVYGSTSADKACDEQSQLFPSNPYSVSKYSQELLSQSYYNSYGLPIIITRGNNVFGPMQYPEKVIPKFCQLLLRNQRLTIQGSGEQKRSFIYIDDTVKAYEMILLKGEIGEIYNIGTIDEFSILEVARKLLVLTQKIESEDEDISAFLTDIPDRNFNDHRYLIDFQKLSKLGWKQDFSFQEGLEKTLDWYRNNMQYWS